MTYHIAGKFGGELNLQLHAALRLWVDVKKHILRTLMVRLRVIKSVYIPLAQHIIDCYMVIFLYTI